MIKYEAIAVYPDNFNEKVTIGIYDTYKEAICALNNHKPFTPYAKILEHFIKAETA